MVARHQPGEGGHAPRAAERGGLAKFGQYGGRRLRPHAGDRDEQVPLPGQLRVGGQVRLDGLLQRGDLLGVGSEQGRERLAGGPLGAPVPVPRPVPDPA